MTDPHRPLKDAFSRFATGVSVVACRRRDGAATAITVNSFTSVSLSPPLVLWCLDKGASAMGAFAESDAYAVSILAAGDAGLSDRFAAHAPSPPAPTQVDSFVTGAPLLKQRLAGFDCRIVARHDAGDHLILVGEVVHFDSRDGAPLLYYASQYASGPSSREAAAREKS